MSSHRIASGKEALLKCLIDNTDANRGCRILHSEFPAQQHGNPDRRKISLAYLVIPCRAIALPLWSKAFNFDVSAGLSSAEQSIFRVSHTAHIRQGLQPAGYIMIEAG